MVQTIIFLFFGLFLAVAPLVFHEMGHWAVLSRYGVPVTEYWLGLGPVLFRWKKFRIGMLPIGGAVVPDSTQYAALAPGQRMAVALAGPAASALYGLVALAGWYFFQNGKHTEVLYLIAMCNFALAGLNLLPVPPLDGFQALCSWLEMDNRPLSQRALGWAYRAGNGLVYGVGFMLLGLALLR